MAKKLRTQVIQFGFIGASNAIVDIVSLNVLLLIWPTKETVLLLTFNTIAYVLAIINSYIWNTKYTFSHRANIDTREISLFIVQAAAALIISNLVFIGAFQLLEAQPLIKIPALISQNISKGLAMFLSSTASFLFMKYLVFRKRSTRQTEY